MTVGHAHHRHWPRDDAWAQGLSDDLRRKLRRLGLGGDGTHWPPARSAESDANVRALRGIGYRGPIDQDGYACEGPGTRPQTFSAGRGVHRDPGRDDYLAGEADARARYDGGFDGDGEIEDLIDRKGWQ